MKENINPKYLQAQTMHPPSGMEDILALSFLGLILIGGLIALYYVFRHRR